MPPARYVFSIAFSTTDICVYSSRNASRFVPRLREQYNKGHIDDRVDADFASLSGDEQEAVVDNVLRSDLETATEHEEEFKAVLQDEVGPTRASILRMTYGEDELWNGVFIRDDLFPHRDSFDVADYRELVEQIRSMKMTIGEIMSDVVSPLRDDYVEDAIEPAPESSQPDSIVFY